MQLKTYQEILQELEANQQECHLLLGNGFNNSLGVNTSYKNIFERMKKEYVGYSKLEAYMQENNYNVEMLIDRLKQDIRNEETLDKDFLPKFIETKVKLDFMKAAYTIVKGAVKDIYNNENTSVHLLFKNFANYFSLNYDPFLYLLLMQFKELKNDNTAIALQNSFNFKNTDWDASLGNIYTEIKKARESGILRTAVGDEIFIKNLRIAKKSVFTTLIKEHFESRKWKNKEIEAVCDAILQEEKGNKKISNTDDGFIKEMFQPDILKKQNVFFLHGAFHIKKIYISSNQQYIEKDSKNASNIFPTQEKVFFDYTTISYK